MNAATSLLQRGPVHAAGPSAAEEVQPEPRDKVFVPAGWYFAGRSGQIKNQPLEVTLGSSKYVAFRGTDGRAAVLDARCSHLGANLANGAVVNGAIRCPLHGWEYAADGRCRHIPASPAIPPFAGQRTYPVRELGGCLYFCNRQTPPYAFPSFERNMEDLSPARPFSLQGEMPWRLVGANAFDLQHFHIAHDRKLLGDPVIDSPAPGARRITAKYEITGGHFRDRVTRLLGGRHQTMTVTVWHGVNMVAQARFARTTSYGLISVHPLSPTRSQLWFHVWVPKRRFPGGAAVDFLDKEMRRAFIREFFTQDITANEGMRYQQGRLIDADRELVSYLDWLAALTAQGESR